jgi:hypothetical protein
MIFTKTTQRSIQRQTRCRQIGLYTLHIAQTALYTTRSTEVERVWRLSQRAQGIHVQAPLQGTETTEAPL